MAAWRPATAAGAAFLASMAVGAGVLAAIGGEGRWPVMPVVVAPVVVAPVAEELAKRLFLGALSAGWAATGLAFGVIEGVLKAAEWQVAGLWGALASVLQHWAYGRWAERGGLRLALALHMGFNALVLAMEHAAGAEAGWLAPLAAAALLAASFPRFHNGDIDEGPPAP
ncbi:hypothetical protein EJV46_10780 [Roseococcus sp. SYP-B2431]|uniref:hypothetical protein n=1 Tax=Roseococcus sp. SYP-B2431 TaxID=2496640 RepID=UPI00103E8778|nr:hypothetical protein [Roseococcus sp. SYP-B2431]TCH99022.1 hypothetical protein EJV46_10780 [Roseococcus sp. SYP-B2431]